MGAAELGVVSSQEVQDADADDQPASKRPRLSAPSARRKLEPKAEGDDIVKDTQWYLTSNSFKLKGHLEVDPDGTIYNVKKVGGEMTSEKLSKDDVYIADIREVFSEEGVATCQHTVTKLWEEGVGFRRLVMPLPAEQLFFD